ncbi:ATPase domain-containing protein [Acidisphaera sp. L21]|uniref:ATPase domain-containing protein n=1 Tax=Acidisphaera sp. L21 TaxID=1641851 RepID=UPI001C205C04|nr:ATPase domain-containing protein [Acidisphaera sp. L21]
MTKEAFGLARIGIAGLDNVLSGGLTRNRLYLVEGTPGTGKTTLALNFLLEGAAQGEQGLYITLSETEVELTEVAASHGWSLDALTIFELVTADGLNVDQEQSVFHPSDVELGETVRGVMAKVDELTPTRVVLDSLSELRLLAQNPLRYRRQILALKHYFATKHCTVLVLDDRTADPGDLQLHSIAHGVITLEQIQSGFGKERRQVRVVKYRGVKYRGGQHDFVIDRGGLRVYPRLIASEHHRDFSLDAVSTGVRELDGLLGGGLVPGTSTLLSGPAGVGKTTTSLRCIMSALERGDRAAYFLFDEGLSTLLVRSAALGMDFGPYLESGTLLIRQIDPAELSPGEFAGAVREAIEQHGAHMICIDSLNAYLKAMPDNNYLALQMHELLSYLNQLGIVTLLVLGYHGLVGDLRVDVDLSYLADSIMFMRFFEASGEVRKAISVVKTRTSDHENTIREYRIGVGGLVVGPPLRNFHGVLSGSPTYDGDHQSLLPRGQP